MNRPHKVVKPDAKIVRYRAGQVPHFVEPSVAPSSATAPSAEKSVASTATYFAAGQRTGVSAAETIRVERDIPSSRNVGRVSIAPAAATTITTKASVLRTVEEQDPRLRRLAERSKQRAAVQGGDAVPRNARHDSASLLPSGATSLEEAAAPPRPPPGRRRKREIFQGDVVQGKTESRNVDMEETSVSVQEPTQDEELAMMERRERLRMRAAALRAQQEQEIVEETAVSEETAVPQAPRDEPPETMEETSESSSEEDEEEEKESPRILYKPTFVPKTARVTVVDRDREEEERKLAEERRNQQLQERKQESHQIVAEHVKKEFMQAIGADKEDNFNEIDDTDGLDAEAEHEAWKLRELLRIKRDRDEMERLAREQEEVERRREMTDAERLADDQAEGIDRFQKEKKQQKFLQRYYHKGAFYQDDVADVLSRDYTAPTLDDHVDRLALPEVLQVKNFGKAGRTKWTHLSKEDTTQIDAAWNQKTEILEKTVRRLGGYHNNDHMDRPTYKKQRTTEERR